MIGEWETESGHIENLKIRPAPLSLYNSRSLHRDLPMRELNPLYNQIKDLKGRDESLRGYL